MVNAPLTLLDLQPPLGSKPYGHMGYFRESAQPLWDEVLDWLQSAPAHTT
jgi:predicted alpha/beta hydrolase